jgi:uncharacterized caspase-like protein
MRGRFLTTQRDVRQFASRFSAALGLAAALMLLFVTEALADKRVALVMGISKYQNVPQLPNPDNDAAAIADVFKQAKFDKVDLRNDLSVSDMRRAVREFAVTAADADLAVVYYAGHGIEVDGSNYLIPVDARLISDFDVEDETVSLDRILQALNPAKRLRLVILDACRDNPFSKTMKRSIGTRSVGRGLAKIEPTTSDTLIAFAAKAGAVANDGDGSHSPFATALMKYIAAPGLDLRIAFGKVRDDVLKSTGNRQEPFVYGSLGGDTVSLVPPPAAPVAVAPPPAPVDPNAEARRDYEFAAQIATKEAWNSFLKAHPDGLYANLAHAAFDKLDAAEQASAKASEAQRKADEQAKQQAADFRRQLEEQAAKQAEETKKQLSEQAKKDLEAARQRIADQAQKQLDAAKQQAADAQRQAAEAQKQVDAVKAQAAADAQKQVDAAKQKAADDAAAQKASADAAAAQKGSQVASLAPQDQPKAPPAAPVPAMDPADIARLLQAHLKRVGCDPGNTDGNWNDSSKKALDLFNKTAGTKFDVKVASLNALDGVRAQTARVCPLVCARGQKADGDHCVAITCDSGSVLGADGACHKRPDPPAKPKAVARSSEPAPRAAAAPAPSRGGGKCFSFNGKQYCE